MNTPITRRFQRAFTAALTLALAAGLLIAGATSAQASDLWLHVTVNEGTEDANVTINLPLSFVEQALQMLPEEEMRSGRIVIDDTEFSATKLREMWQAVQDAPDDVNFITVEEKDQVLSISKSRDYLLVKGEARSENGAQIDVRIPTAVVDALLSSENDNELNIAAALQALAAHGEGELATITDDNAKVRVWIDPFPQVVL
ncbi:MAG: hypothetical protein AAGD01_16410 [Acidobacteriota bacterium]